MGDNKKLLTKEKVSYGLGDLGINIAYGAVGFYFVFFLTDVAGLPPAWAGYLFAIARIWDAVTDPLMGVISDRTESRFGRRRPYLLFGAVPLGICFTLLWLVPFHRGSSLFIYFFVATVLFNTAYTVVAMPYNSLLPAMTQNYDERTSLAGYKMAFSFMGTLISAAGIMFIVDVVFGGKSNYANSFPVMGSILAVMIIISTLLVFFGTKERITPKQNNESLKYIQTLRSFFKMKEFRKVLGMFLFNMIGFDIIMAMNVYFMKYVVEMKDEISFVFMAIPLLTAALVTPVWVAISKRRGKQRAYMAAILYFMIPLFLCLIIPAGNIPFVVVIVVLMGIGVSASQLFPYSILPDFIEYDEYRNGVRREGAFYGIVMFTYKLASALCVVIISMTLGLFGYIESSGEVVVQPASAILGIRLLMGMVPAVFFIISAVFVKRLSMNQKMFNEMKQSMATGNDNRKISSGGEVET